MVIIVDGMKTLYKILVILLGIVIAIDAGPIYAQCCLGNLTDDFEDGTLQPLWVNGSTCGIASESGGKLVLDKPSGCSGTTAVRANLNSA